MLPNPTGRIISADVEGTGYNEPGLPCLVEIGAVELINLQPTGRVFHSKINPKGPVNHFATRIHGHTRKSLRDEADFGVLGPLFHNFVGDSPVFMHNAQGDWLCLKHDCDIYEIQNITEHQVYDSERLGRILLQTKSLSLDTMCDSS